MVLDYTYDLQMSTPFNDDADFDEEEWNKIIYSDDMLTERSETTDDSNDGLQNNDIIKSPFNDFTRASFINSDRLIQIGRSMQIVTPPYPHQRVRYENECLRTYRYISVPNNRNLTIEIPDLRTSLLANDALWMRITRTTVNNRNDRLIFYHPYPIWIKNRNARVHNGSIFIPITNKDMENRFLEIGTLAMIRLKQDKLKSVSTLGIYSPTQLNTCGTHTIEIDTAKRIRDEYHLRQSILNFQLVRVDGHNIAYVTDCFCQTGPLVEREANQ